MRLMFFKVGVETATIFLFQKVVVLFLARDNGSPSLPAEEGKRSTSSASKILMGLEANPLGELAPTSDSDPPGKIL